MLEEKFTDPKIPYKESNIVIYLVIWQVSNTVPSTFEIFHYNGLVQSAADGQVLYHDFRGCDVKKYFRKVGFLIVLLRTD